MKQQRLIIVSGMSGAGKTVALNTLEDLGFYCIDNLPISLLKHVNDDFIQQNRKSYDLIAIGIDARNPEHDFSELPKYIHELEKNNINAEVLFIDADNDVLTKRFSETRRKHPLSDEKTPLNKAIQQERNIIGTLAECAEIRIDTSVMQLHELRALIKHRVAEHDGNTMSVQLISFGYKHGIPQDADFVFDVRCLVNPYWKKSLRPYSGKDPAVVEFLSKDESVNTMLDDIHNFIAYWIPKFEDDNRSYLSIAIGCTGGHHRSVFISEQLAKRLKQKKSNLILTHRDL